MAGGTLCSVSECGRVAQYRTGLCAMHEKRRIRGQPLEGPSRIGSYGAQCCVEGCTNREDARGLCRTHYARHRRGLLLDTPVRPPRPKREIGSKRFYNAYVMVKTEAQSVPL